MFLKLAWRNIWRNKRRTQILVISISFAVLYTTYTQSSKFGLYDNMIKSTVQFFTGYVQVHKAGFWEERSINDAFALEDSLMGNLLAQGKIREIVPRLETYALASGNEGTKGVMVVGIDPLKENQLTQLKDRLVEGEYLAKEDHQVLIGKGVAEYFKIGLGDTLILVGQGYHGANAVNQYQVKGILKYPNEDFNNGIVYLPLQASQELFATENQVTGYALILEQDQVEAVHASLSAALDKETYEVMDWKSMQPALVQTIAFDQYIISFIYYILYAILGFGIFSTFYMMVNERTYEFGIILASGMKRYQLKMITYLEVIMIGVTGISVGLISSFLVLFYLNRNPIQITGDEALAYKDLGIEPIMSYSIAPSIFIEQSLVVLFISLLIGLYSLRKISKLNIVTAIRE